MRLNTNKRRRWLTEVLLRKRSCWFLIIPRTQMRISHGKTKYNAYQRVFFLRKLPIFFHPLFSTLSGIHLNCTKWVSCWRRKCLQVDSEGLSRCVCLNVGRNSWISSNTLWSEFEGSLSRDPVFHSYNLCLLSFLIATLRVVISFHTCPKLHKETSFRSEEPMVQGEIGEHQLVLSNTDKKVFKDCC